MANNSSQDFKGHRWSAALYDGFNRGTERKFISKHRAHVAGEADGRVLELGAGTGANFPYYTKAEKVIATEPDPYMLERARRRLRELDLRHIELVPHAAEELPFGDRTFDHVVSALVLCTVGDPGRCLAEAQRVLKPGGTFRFIEHVRFDSGLRGRLQDVITPVWRWFGAGCHPNRRTLDTLLEAGFEMLDLQRHTLSAIQPMIVGVARRP